MAVSSTLPRPEKDFKARVLNGRVTAVGTGIFDDAVAAQPFEKHSDKDEENPDGVLEMPVEVRYENTSLQRLVEFLYAVNKSEDAMMDVREIEIAVRGRNVGALNGKLVLTCAYLKGDAPEEKTK